MKQCQVNLMHASLMKYFTSFPLSMQACGHTHTHTHICLRSIWLFVTLPYLDGEGEWLCRPYCLSHSSLSFSRLSRSLSEESLGEMIATREYQRVHLNTHRQLIVSYFMRILRAMARSSPSRSCKSNTQSSGEGTGQWGCFFNA